MYKFKQSYAMSVHEHILRLIRKIKLFIKAARILPQRIYAMDIKGFGR